MSRIETEDLDDPIAADFFLRQQPDDEEDEDEGEENGNGKRHDENEDEDNDDDGYSVRALP